jgi:hypothetical protein
MQCPTHAWLNLRLVSEKMLVELLCGAETNTGVREAAAAPCVGDARSAELATSEKYER